VFAGLLCLAVLLSCGCRGITRPEYNTDYQGTRGNGPPNVEEILQIYPELKGVIMTAPEFMEEFEREKKEAEARGEAGAQEWRIQTGISMGIEVVDEPSLTRTVIVRPDGLIDLPYVGEIQIAGKTIKEAKLEITDRLKKILVNPQVVISPQVITGTWGGRPSIGLSGDIAIIGQVTSKGLISFTGSETLVSILAGAGWLPEDAEWRSVRVIKKDPAKKKTRIILCDMFAYTTFGDQRQDVPLSSGDVVFVPKHWTAGDQFAKDWDIVVKYTTGWLPLDGVREYVKKTY
jgi:polysaccharide export outer membrane protein